MSTYAVLSDNTVTNIIVCETQTLAEEVTGQTCIEYTPENPAGIGWTYDEATGTFTPPVSE